MEINPDKIIVFTIGTISINSTILYTWIVMAILVIASWCVTRSLSVGPDIPPLQHFLESVVGLINNQIRDITGSGYAAYFPYLGTLFLFIFASNILKVVPLFHPPTASFSTTTALAFTVFIAVPLFGIIKNGFTGHLKYYLEPVFIMLPFNILSEFTRTMAMAIRLFGNIMSESLIGAVLLLIAPLFIPLVMNFFGMIIGIVQAYIFFILATVFIGAAAAERRSENIEPDLFITEFRR